MHQQFKELILKAQGESQFVIAIFADIRGFSAFSQERESPDTAMYVKRVYTTLIEKYFPNASFFKPTGDGLMLIVPFGESNLADVSGKVIKSALECIADFASICNADPMINFSVPSNIGFGIARGTACRLHAEEKTLDYSGRLLNLAARLTSLARPNGLVLDGDFKEVMIPQSERARFKQSTVYLRGISEVSPRVVFLLDTVTELPKENTAPLRESIWKTTEFKTTLADLKKLTPIYILKLSSAPDAESIKVKISHQMYKNKKIVKGHQTNQILVLERDYTYVVDAGKHNIRLKLDSILARLQLKGLPKKISLAVVASFKEL